MASFDLVGRLKGLEVACGGLGSAIGTFQGKRERCTAFLLAKTKLDR